MNRRDWLRMGGAALSLPQASQAWQATPPYPGVAYRPYARCLPAYLKELAAAAYKRRNLELEKITTLDQLSERKRWARQTYWSLIGGQPERTPLNARTVGQFERPGYKVEKVIYESRPGFPVTANLYRPAIPRRGPSPAVLVQMGHGAPGKAYPTYQRLCQGLVKLGYTVLAFDPMGQGERMYYPDASGKRSRTGGPTEEHSTAGRQMLLTGDTATRMQTWDAVRSLDYLYGLPFVDKNRIGLAGQSGGGTASMFLAAVDDRIAAVVLSSANTENFCTADFNAPGSTDDAEQNLLFSGPAGFDRWDMLYPMAPKPLLVSVSDKDFFGTYSPQYISSGWEEFQKLKRMYALAGQSEKLAWGGTPLPHSLAYDTRLLVYNWFQRWFRNDAKSITEEPDTKPEPDEVLNCTETGSVMKSLASATPQQLNRKRLGRPLTPVPLERLLHLDKPPAPVCTLLRRTVSRGVDIEAIEIPSATHVWVPAWLFLPRPVRTPKPLIVVLDSTSRSDDWHEGELYQNLALQGFAICAPDLRGVGDLAPEIGSGNPRFTRAHAEEEEYAWASLILGRPMLGQRVSDILAVVRALKTYGPVQNRPILLAAQGRLTVPALFATALLTAIGKLFLSGGLSSFRSIVESELYGHTFANFIPGILEHIDLPEVAAQTAPRHVTLAAMHDGAGRRLPADDIKRLYEKTRNLEVLDSLAWNSETMARLANA